MKLKKIKSVIFDMDGVLIDSMPYHVKAWELAFEKYGLKINSEIIYELEGSDYKQTVKIIFERMGKKVKKQDIEFLRKEQDKIFNEIVKIKPFDGVVKLLKILEKKYDLAIVSGSNRKNVEKIVENNFKNVFKVLITGDDTNKSKPDPEPYLKALIALNIKKNEVIVIENAPLGIQSAKNANLFCIGLKTYLGDSFLNKADIILENHEKLEKYLLN
jgi:HAD superfamily hydrolase (TIGR01509 family)